MSLPTEKDRQRAFQQQNSIRVTSTDEDVEAGNSYQPFPDQQQPNRKQVDKKIFIPLYIVTATILLLPVLPLSLRLILVFCWAVLFIWTPLYYLYYYDPDNNSSCGGCCTEDQDAAVRK